MREHDFRDIFTDKMFPDIENEQGLSHLQYL